MTVPTETILVYPESSRSAGLRADAAARIPLHGERHSLGTQVKRWVNPIWILLIGGFALLHFPHLTADFPNHSPWIFDFAKYTDEGWWGNAAIRAHLNGNWYLAGDFNPAAAAPAWPLLEWILFFFTGVSMAAARGLAVAIFVVNLGLSYLFLRVSGRRSTAILGLTLLATSPFLYAFSRLAILEPLLIALTLGALNLAVRLPHFRRAAAVSAAIGLMFTAMMLTKTTAVFLLPSIGWAMIAPLWSRRKMALRCALAAIGTSALTFGIWMALIAHFRLLADYRYLFFVNRYEKPSEFYWPLLSLWWSLRGSLWADRILIPLAGIVIIAVALAWRSEWSARLRREPVFVSSLLAVLGYILFMTYQNHPQPRYYAVVAFFSFFVLVAGIEALFSNPKAVTRRRLGLVFLVAAVTAACFNGEWTLDYVRHPEFTFVPAVEKMTAFIDQHPNGKRLLLSTSSDEITMISHLPTICDDFGTQDLVSKLKVYQPGWFATWNYVDPGTLEDLHNHYSVEQVAGFRALDNPDRNILFLFKLHPLPAGQFREPRGEDLQAPLPGDEIDIPVE